MACVPFYEGRYEGGSRCGFNVASLFGFQNARFVRFFSLVRKHQPQYLFSSSVSQT